MSHFQGQCSWPRKISTKATDNRQVVVNTRAEALTRFTQANFLDCRISAYPPPSKVSSFVGVNLDIAPSIIMIDLDREIFKTQRAFEMAQSVTLKKINKTIISAPTVIWSGSGYHNYLVLDAFVLETEDAFNNSRFGSSPSQKFLRFAEWFLTNGKCDPQHNKTVSFRNCMLRIPGSVNSKNGQTVRILQKWNHYRPDIRLLLGSFHAWLVDQKIKGSEEQYRRQQDYPSPRYRVNTIRWIERLLTIPIQDYRKLVIWHILAPYLITKRGLSHNESYSIIYDWLYKCNKFKRLDFNPNYKINAALKCSNGFLPISREKLKTENEGFYRLLQDNGVFAL